MINPEQATDRKMLINYIKENKNMKNTKTNEIKIDTKVAVPVKKTQSKVIAVEAVVEKKSRAKVQPKVNVGLKIEKGIAIPTNRNRNEFTDIAPKMNVGDSVLVKQLPKTLYTTGKRLGIKFTNRKVDGGFRIWRKM